MTSKRRYAVAALALSAFLPLSACSQAAPAKREATPKASATTHVPPAPVPVRLTSMQAKAVGLLSQRATGNVYPGSPRAEALDWEACGESVRTPADATWISGSQADPESLSPSEAELAKIDVGGSHSVVTIFKDAAGEKEWDARLSKWAAACPDEDGAVTPVAVDLEGADSTFGFSQAQPKGSLPRKAVSVVMARTGNVGILCYLEAKNVAIANKAASMCAENLVGGAHVIAEPLSSPDILGSKALLAGLVTRADAKSEVTFDQMNKVSPPCPAMSTGFMPENAAKASFRPAGTDMYQPATASAGVMAMADAAAAKARVAEARETFGQCAGDYQFQAGPKKVPGQILGVDDVSFGDGGFAIRDELRWPKGKPEQGYTAIFSVGPFVVQVDQWQSGQGKLISQAIADMGEKE